MPESEPRPLHLHTLDSLIADLVSGRAVRTSTVERFHLPDDQTRSALEWYRKRGPAGWKLSVSAQRGEDLVDCIFQKPPELVARPARTAHASSRRLRLKKLEAHRFAGLHKFGTPGAAPENYVHEFTTSLALFEGRNGSAKPSKSGLVNTLLRAWHWEISLTWDTLLTSRSVSFVRRCARKLRCGARGFISARFLTPPMS